MELTTILNRCHRFRGFVYQHARFIADKKSIEVDSRRMASEGRTPLLKKSRFQRRRGGPKQQSQSHHEKILRLSHLPSARTCPLSFTWKAARAGIYPRILLTNQK